MSERAGEVECTGEEERECDLNDVGPKQLKPVQPVRLVAPTGQTGLAQADRKSFCLAICRMS